MTLAQTRSSGGRKKTKMADVKPILQVENNGMDFVAICRMLEVGREIGRKNYDRLHIARNRRGSA
jgi:hypothetical protein